MTMTSVRGYYDGESVVISDDDKKRMYAGQELIITILGIPAKEEPRIQKRKRLLNGQVYVIPSGRTADEIDQEIKELRGMCIFCI